MKKQSKNLPDRVSNMTKPGGKGAANMLQGYTGMSGGKGKKKGKK